MVHIRDESQFVRRNQEPVQVVIVQEGGGVLGQQYLLFPSAVSKVYEDLLQKQALMTRLESTPDSIKLTMHVANEAVDPCKEPDNPRISSYDVVYITRDSDLFLQSLNDRLQSEAAPIFRELLIQSFDREGLTIRVSNPLSFSTYPQEYASSILQIKTDILGH